MAAQLPPGTHAISVKGQRKFANSDKDFPLVLTPDSQSVSLKEWEQTLESWAKGGHLQQLLDKHGALILRGFPLKSAEDFSSLQFTFGWESHVEIGNPVKRKVHAKNVAAANEGPPSLYIPAHTEFGISQHFPSHICFFALEVPTEGGETPLNSGVQLLHELRRQAPEFIEELNEKGVNYTIFHPAQQLSGDANGNGVRSAFGQGVQLEDDLVTTRAKIEANVKKISPTSSHQWTEAGDLYTFQRVPAFRKHPSTGETTVFGNLTSYYGGAKQMGTLDPPHLQQGTNFWKPPPRYGNDQLIPLQYLELMERIVCETRAAIRWEQGDVMVLDNLQVQHARLPWTAGDRKIVASLWDSGAEKLAAPQRA